MIMTAPQKSATRQPSRAARAPSTKKTTDSFVPLDARLSYQISTLAQALDRQSTRLLAQYEISLVEWRILTSLDHYGAGSLTSLLPLASVDRALVSRELAKLEDRRLVASAIDPADGRRKIIKLTAAGKKLHDRVLPAMLVRHRELATALGDDERTIFEKIISQLKRVLRTQADAS
ncbi:MAG: MarR family transcriptional regulator [Alphaproteobacteria bacterium]|nr:MarR family transcriptional regulator [Alphaproteobacteria bacterium]